MGNDDPVEGLSHVDFGDLMMLVRFHTCRMSWVLVEQDMRVPLNKTAARPRYSFTITGAFSTVDTVE